MPERFKVPCRVDVAAGEGAKAALARAVGVVAECEARRAGAVGFHKDFKAGLKQH
jgi:hypothetical protein